VLSGVFKTIPLLIRLRLHQPPLNHRHPILLVACKKTVVSDRAAVGEEKAFRPYDPDQVLLMAPVLQEWIPDGDLAHFVSESKTVGRNVAKSLHTDRIPRSPARFASWQQGQLRAAIFTSPRVAKPPSRLIWSSPARLIFRRSMTPIVEERRVSAVMTRG
jgi:hypothetical protein